MEIRKWLLRQEMSERRNKLPRELLETKSKQLFEQLSKQEIYQKANEIYSYVSFRSEVDTWDFHRKVLSDGKKLMLPKVISKTEMTFFEVADLNQLEKGYMGILEPGLSCKKSQISFSNPLMLVPGLAFDPMFYRMGYGGGYYDRYLEKNKGRFITCGICLSLQLIENVPHEIHDFRMDYIVTEKEWIERTDGQ